MLEQMSTITEPAVTEAAITEPADSGLTHRIGQRTRALRRDRGLSLDALAQRSGVSRSMISAVERGRSSPTAAVLERLAAGLDVPLASLFDPPAPRPGPVARGGQQQEWVDPATGYRRWNRSPAGAGSPIRIVEVELPAAATVTYDETTRSTPVDHQVWVLEGGLEVTVAGTTHHLGRGDCLAYALDGPSTFRNPGPAATRYAVVAVLPGGRR